MADELELTKEEMIDLATKDDEPSEPAAEKKPVEPAPQDDDLPTKLKNYESTIGRQGQQLDSLQRELEAIREERRRQAEEQRMFERQAQRPSDVIAEDQFDFNKPVTSTREIIRREIEARDRAMYERNSQQAQVMYRDMVNNSYTEGRQRAIASKNPVYNGIEQDVEQLIWGGLVSGKIEPKYAASEEAWRMGAGLIRLQRGELDRLSSSPGVSPDSGDVPMQIKGRPGAGSDISLDEGSQRLMKGFGLNAEDARKIIAEERASRGEG